MTTEILVNKDKKGIPWLQIISIIVSITTFLFGSGYFYNNVIRRPILTYTLLPNYDLGNQFFNGVVIENRGRENQTDINIEIANLDSEIIKLHFPGIHEPTDIITGGVGTKSVRINMPRLSAGKALSVYFLTLQAIRLDEVNLLVSSSETVGQASGENITIWSATSIVSASITILAAIFSIWNVISLRITIAKRKEKEYVTMQELLKVNQSIQHLKKDITKLSEDTTKLSEDTTKLSDRLSEDTTKLSEKTAKLSEDATKLSDSTEELGDITKALKAEQDNLKESFSQLDGIKNELLKKLESVSQFITELDTTIRKSLDLGELESNERTKKILAILEQFQERIQEDAKTTKALITTVEPSSE